MEMMLCRLQFWRKQKKGIPQNNKKTSPNQNRQQISHQRKKYLGNSNCKITLWTLLKMVKGRTRINGPKNKETDNDARGLTHERRHRQVQSSLQASNNKGILNTRTRLWLTESKQAIPVVSIKDVVRSSVKVPEFDKQLKQAGGHIGRNVMEITIKMKTIVRKPLMIRINKLRLRNLDN